MTATSSVTGEQVKAFHHAFFTGVTAVTTIGDGQPRGLVVNAFSSLTLDPPTILVCVQKTSSSHDFLFSRDAFAVSILAADQAGIAARLATKAPDKFDGIPWEPGPYGSPVVLDASAWLEAETTDRIQASTHTVLIARVVAVGNSGRPPLIYGAGRFHRIDPDAPPPLTDGRGRR